MRILALSTLRTFWEQPKYKDAEQPLKAWYDEAKHAIWQKPQNIKDKYRNAIFIADNRVVFNIHGNKYRLIVVLWEAQPNTPKGDEFEILATLIHVYENEHCPIDAPDPVEAIKFRMEQQGLEDIDLVPMLGQRSRVTEILKNNENSV